jgi:hypothetical protein
MDPQLLELVKLAVTTVVSMMWATSRGAFPAVRRLSRQANETLCWSSGRWRPQS